MGIERTVWLLGQAAEISQRNLYHEQDALDYLTKTRGLTPQTISLFGLGVWRTDLILYMLSQHPLAPLEWELERAGISRSLEDRITIPMRSPTGYYTLGLIGRLLPSIQRPVRYLYPAAQQITRRQHLLGIDTILRKDQRLDHIVLVEGPMDAIACQQIGIPAVCSHGHSFTKAQALMIRALCPKRLIIIADWDPDRSDKKGRTGEESLRISAKKHADALPQDTRFATCPEGTDPADLAISVPETLIDLIKEAPVLA